jgi:ferrous iron transport protein A
MTDSKDKCNQNQKLKKWGFKFFDRTPQTAKAKNDTLKGDSSTDGKSFPLAMARVGERLEVAKLKGGEGTVHRLIGMGLIQGTELQIVNIVNENIIVAVGDNRIGLGKGLAQKIICKNV